MSILQLLKDKRVMAMEPTANRDAVEVYEFCDEDFGVILTKVELIQLAQEITQLANSLT